MPRVSVVIPLYNQERYIRECVQSALDQTWPDVEVIVVDDGSTDGSPKVLEPFADRITVIRQRNQGPSKALNAGILASTGEYIAWMGSDDVFLPAKTARQVAVMEGAGPAVGVLHSDAVVIDGEGRTLRNWKCPAVAPEHFAATILRNGNFVNGATTLIRRECFEKAGLFDEELRADCDCDLWLRIARRYRIHHMPEYTVKYRWHAGNVSHDTELMLRCMDIVRSRALEAWSREELFPRATDFAGEYEAVAVRLAAQCLLASARLALENAASVRGWTLRLRSIAVLLSVLSLPSPVTLSRALRPIIASLPGNRP